MNAIRIEKPGSSGFVSGTLFAQSLRFAAYVGASRRILFLPIFAVNGHLRPRKREIGQGAPLLRGRGLTGTLHGCIGVLPERLRVGSKYIGF